MNLTEILLARRSVRRYADAPIREDTLREILTAGLLAPTSRNLKPCRFTVVRDKATMEALSGAKAAGGSFLGEAGAAVVVSADAVLADTWIEDCSIALTCMHLAAAEAGVGSCWIQIHLRRDREGTEAEENVRRILGLEDGLRTVGILALGVPAVSPEPHKTEEADFGAVRFVD